MKYAKVLTLGLVAFALLGCNQTPAANNNDNLIESIQSQQQDSDPLSGETIDKPSVPSNPDSNIVAKKKDKKTQTGNQIGSRFDCNGDGKANGARIDYNGDRIPDECIEQDEKAKSVIDETSYQTVLNSLESITKGCTKTEKNEGVLNYSICKKAGEIVSASEYHSEAGAGLSFWFNNSKVVAVQRPHSEELFLYDNNGKLKSKFIYPRKVRNISNQDREDAKYLYNGYDRIFAAFNNNSSAKASSSQSGIIDETSFQTVSKSLDAITKGCTKTKKTEKYTDYEICKKGDRVVSASEYATEADAGLAYWFSPDGRVVAARYLASGDLYIFDSSGKVSSKIEVYESKKINNISAEEQKRVEENLYFNYKDILKVFNL